MRPGDHETRERVLNPEQSFIVQAPAGSGKTELLVRRYLRLLGVVNAPEEIVAITFTRKAAAAMRNRIIEALKTGEPGDADNGSEEDAIAQARRRLAAPALARDRELNWQLAQNPARMRIQTIDSFCAGLTQQMPLLSLLAGQPEIIEDAEELYREAAHNTLKQMDEDNPLESGRNGRGTAIETLLAHLDNDLPGARNMLVEMLKKRDQWLRHLVGRRPDREALEDALNHIVEATLDATLEILPDDLMAEFTACLRYAADNLDDPPYFIEKLPGTSGVDLGCWRFIVSLCLTGKGDWRKRVSAREGFPPGDVGKDMKHRFQSLLARFADCERLRELFLEIRALPPTSYSDREWRVLEALYELLVLANAQLHMLFAERNQVDFTGLSLAALRALGPEDSPTDLALYLDYRIVHILVDEYQDVSINQYELLEKLTAGWSMEDGHSLFLVGDPMQSIYRFREAEVGVFLATWEQQRVGQVPVNPEKIEVNFRSDRTLVDWVNRAYREVLPGEPDVARGAVSFTPAAGFRELTGENGVHVHPIFIHDRGQDRSRTDAREAELVLEQIRKIQALSNSESIAILVRSRPHLKSITALLTQREVPFQAVEIEHLETRPVIQDLLALTRALHHPADRVAWLALLRAPWCGLKLADLLTLSANSRNDTIWNCLQDKQRLAALSPDGRHRAARLYDVLEQAYALQGRMPLRRWVESAWLNLGGPATLETATDLRNAGRFFELLDELDRGGDLLGTEELVKRVKGLYARADTRADDTLQVMSIHRAKGLEFDHVILPGLSRRSRSDDPQLLLWSENPRSEDPQSDGSDLLLAPVRASDEENSPIYDFIRGLEKKKQYHEEGRLLYVAATRARKSLHLIGNINVEEDGELAHPPNNTLLAQLWPAIEPDFQAKLGKQAQQDEQEALPAETGDTNLRRLVADWQLPAPPSPVKWIGSVEPGAEQQDPDNRDSRIEYQWAGRTIMHVGTVVHRYLQVMASEGIARWNTGRIGELRQNSLESLRALDVPEEELETACDWVEQALTSVLADPRGQWVLAGHREQNSEYALTGVYRGNIINIVVDRTFVDEEGTRWIVDYKTSRHESGDTDEFLDLQQERYREQLERYAAVVSALDDRPIRLGLYFPLLRGWREWAFS
ncbi:MAG: UvrD-helicase domain-containing protein [Gammaproteobacteria bacterium]|nr:UvrD-helicase domain-containing protein [Gammaproteobacteria bacterium]